MLTTEERARLPRSLAYPATLGDLRAWLGERFAAEEVEVCFSASPFTFKSMFDAALATGRLYPIIRLEFRRRDKSVSTGDSAWARRHLAGFWALHVYPVPSARRAAVRAEVLASALPAMAAWALQPRPPGWFFGRKVGEVVYGSRESRVAFREREEAV